MDKNQLTKLEKYWISMISEILHLSFWYQRSSQSISKTLHLPTEFPFRTPPPTTDTLCLFRH